MQELSKGCVVKIPIYHTVNSHSSGTYWRSHSVITIDQVSGELIVNRFQRYGNKRVSSNSEMKIIGHPIHLEEIICAIKDRMGVPVDEKHKVLESACSSSILAMTNRYSFEKPFTDQSDDLYKFIVDILS